MLITSYTTTNMVPFLALAAAICSLLPNAALSDNSRPSAAYVNDLHKHFIIVAEKHPDLMELLNQAVRQAKAKSSLDFFSQFEFCSEENETRSALVSQQKQYKVFYLSRDLSEPSGTSEDLLKVHYLERFKDSFTNSLDPVVMQWDFQADIIRVVDANDSRKICLRQGQPNDFLIELIAHELVHYVNTPNQIEKVDPLDFSDLNDYAANMVLKPGDEVDAYTYDLSLRVRLKGRRAIGRNPLVAMLFSDSGKFIGKREDLTRYILVDLGYINSRFKEEYERLLQLQLNDEVRQLKIFQELLASREKQESELRILLNSRYNFLDVIWSKHRTTSEDLRFLYKSAQQSKERIAKAITLHKAREIQLRSRLGLP